MPAVRIKQISILSASTGAFTRVPLIPRRRREQHGERQQAPRLARLAQAIIQPPAAIISTDVRHFSSIARGLARNTETQKISTAMSSSTLASGKRTFAFHGYVPTAQRTATPLVQSADW